MDCKQNEEIAVIYNSTQLNTIDAGANTSTFGVQYVYSQIIMYNTNVITVIFAHLCF